MVAIIAHSNQNEIIQENIKMNFLNFLVPTRCKKQLSEKNKNKVLKIQSGSAVNVNFIKA